jgi:hypothetical protein
LHKTVLHGRTDRVIEMNTSERLLAGARALREQAYSCIGYAARAVQTGAEHAAHRIDAAGPHIASLAAAGRDLTEISTRCAGHLLEQGLASVQGALADGSQRLRSAAEADSLTSLYQAQRASLPGSRARILGELEATWRILTSTGRELTALALRTRRELAGADAPARTRARRGASRSRAAGRHRERRPAESKD